MPKPTLVVSVSSANGNDAEKQWKGDVIRCGLSFLRSHSWPHFKFKCTQKHAIFNVVLVLSKCWDFVVLWAKISSYFLMCFSKVDLIIYLYDLNILVDTWDRLKKYVCTKNGKRKVTNSFLAVPQWAHIVFHL